MNAIAGIYHYHRIDHDERELELLPDGTVGLGADGAERQWSVSTCAHHSSRQCHPLSR